MDIESLIPFLNTIEKYKNVTKNDIAYISLGQKDFYNIPADSLTYDEFRHRWIKKYCDITIVENKSLIPIISIEDLRTRIAWKLTGNTQPIFKDYGRNK